MIREKSTEDQKCPGITAITYHPFIYDSYIHLYVLYFYTILNTYFIMKSTTG